MQSRKRHAPYGTACSECSRTKSRCIATSPGSPCERCQRLGKDCVPSNHKRTQKSTENDEPSQPSQLEAKIDGLVSLITKNTHETPAGSVFSSSHISLPVTLSPQADGDLLSYINEVSSSINDEDVLSHFKKAHHPHLPFLSLPSDSPPSSLRQERPFLWLCLVAVSESHTLPQAAFNDKVRRIVAQRMVLNLERNLELLQGLLVCIAWGNFQVHQRPFLTLFTQLANTIVFDLGLNQPPQIIPEAMLRLTIHRPWVSGTRTVEEQRAVVACYYLSSIVSSYMRRTDRLLWTRYMSTCLDDLTISGTPGDAALVYVVKISRILDRAFYSPPNSQMPVLETPADFVAAALQTELEKLATEAPYPVESPVIACHHTYASFAISEFTLTLPSPDPQHLYTTYEALKSYFNAFLSFQPSEYSGFTLAELYQTMHAALSLRKLSSQLTTQMYDKQRVEKLADWYQQVIRNLGDASMHPGAKRDGKSAVFRKLASMLEPFTWESGEGLGRQGDNELNIDGITSELTVTGIPSYIDGMMQPPAANQQYVKWSGIADRLSVKPDDYKGVISQHAQNSINAPINNTKYGVNSVLQGGEYLMRSKSFTQDDVEKWMYKTGSINAMGLILQAQNVYITLTFNLSSYSIGKYYTGAFFCQRQPKCAPRILYLNTISRPSFRKPTIFPRRTFPSGTPSASTRTATSSYITPGRRYHQVAPFWIY
ncbi:uncharacterized protein GLRG_00372 [Colletotrichum graminicola M1.001]|uniref:Zn(2)-C6 fungal-type domain-containing protein n=1 Tax=Colletotrichum graminicola (strain M1.001 / M2 / FGSC 10212) TaxID=645133 RepID=E3Q2C7_COLGM|nr:uncharacterized protein GLRG_00372 [Colletotrichum graminicola M1.001]EFQ25228.1 hypothetical protein GLRG_00372 [Colletotrichum graminicola M1.001]